MSLLRKKLIAFFVILGIIFGSFSVHGATPTPTVAPEVSPVMYVLDLNITNQSFGGIPSSKRGSVRINPPGITVTSHTTQTYQAGTTVTLKAIDSTTLPGFPCLFSSWSGDISSTQSQVSLIMDGNKSVTANFKIFSPTITPTRRPTVTPTPTLRITPTPRTIINPTIPPDVIVTFYVEKVRDAIEGSTSGQFRVWATQTGPTTVNAWVQIGFTLSGTATIGTDYSVGRFASIGHDPPNTIYVKVGNPGPLPTADHEQDNIQINAYPDALIEGPETVTVTLTGVTVGAGMGSATLDILDGTVVTPGPTATPTPTPGPGGYVVSYAIQSDWGNGATVNATIKNNTTAAVIGWTLAWTFSGNQTITSMWNAAYTQTGASVLVKNPVFNAIIPANGGSVNFGFNLSYSGTNLKPTSFTLNGTPCQLQ